MVQPQAAGGITHWERDSLPLSAELAQSLEKDLALQASSPDPGGGCGKTVNTIKMKAHGKNGQGGKLPSGK